MIEIDIYFDGACHNQKGSIVEPFGSGVAVFIDQEYSEMFSTYEIAGLGTSNIAEWKGCIQALKIARTLSNLITSGAAGPKSEHLITIYSDSQLISRQLNGEYEVRQEHFIELYNKCKSIAESFGYKEKIVWIPRERNQKADELSKIALNKYREWQKTENHYYYHDESDSLFVAPKSSAETEGSLQCLEIGPCIFSSTEELYETLEESRMSWLIQDIKNNKITIDLICQQPS